MLLKCADFNPEAYFRDCAKVKNRRGNPAGKSRHYLGIVTAFDIETSIIPGTEQSIMYIWQWQFGEDYTVIGRTWEEFTDLQERIKSSLPSGYWLVVYVHSLAYEFQFLKGVYSFHPDEVFAVASRKPLKCDMLGCFEFRCSYKLTNMSLSQFTRKMGVAHQKLSGDEYNYSVVRYPWTELTDRELEYCTNDVLGLVEAINALMARDGDTLQTIPLTSTGYVRRNAKRAMREGMHHSFVYSILPNYEVYCALREAFRGGNTHASRFFSGDIVHNVHSADRSSSYPAVICNCEFPMTEFIPILPKDLNIGYVTRCITIRHKALLLRVGIYNLRLKNPYWGCPYISKDKCRNIHKGVDTEDNGRILSADYLETTITDIDLKIILSEYDGELVILQGWYASYKPLPAPLVEEVKKYYRDKTELKGIPGQEVYYDKAKSLLNSLYGMMAQSSIKAHQIFRQDGDFETDYSIIEENDSLSWEEKRERITALEMELLGKYNKKAFLAYQWGVWVCSWARLCLEQGIELVHNTEGAEFVYCDTDSVKYIGNVDWTEYNKQRIAECLNSGAYATDAKGKTHYMGVFENEDNPETGYSYYEFKTLGAKKYAYTEKPSEVWTDTIKIGETEYQYTRVGRRTHCTIAGVNKKKGGAELDKHGGIQALEEGFTFREAGGTMAVYNDVIETPEMSIDGHHIKITSNVAILPSEYTVGLTAEYKRILQFSHSYLDNPYVI